MTRRMIFTILTLLCMAFIFHFSAQNATISSKESNTIGIYICQIFYTGYENMPDEKKIALAESIDRPIRKGAHMTEYAILGALCLGIFYDRSKNPLKTSLYGIFVSVAYAASDEIHQSFVPGRASLITDVGIDTIGALIGICIVNVFCYFYKRH